MTECPECRKKVRSDEEKRALTNRLSRIEGQVRGIKQMVEDDRYCVDVLTQAAAVKSALAGFITELMSSHIKSCVYEDIKNGGDEKVDELIMTLQKFIK